MAKKRTTIYMREEDLVWLEQCPVADSVSGSAVLIMEWAMKQVQRGSKTALEKLDKDERLMIIHYASFMTLTADFSPAVLVISLGDWFRYDAGAGYWVDKYKINVFMKKCEELSPAEMIGLLAWARGYWAQEGKKTLDEYVEEA